MVTHQVVPFTQRSQLTHLTRRRYKQRQLIAPTRARAPGHIARVRRGETWIYIPLKYAAADRQVASNHALPRTARNHYLMLAPANNTSSPTIHRFHDLPRVYNIMPPDRTIVSYTHIYTVYVTTSVSRRSGESRANFSSRRGVSFRVVTELTTRINEVRSFGRAV